MIVISQNLINTLVRLIVGLNLEVILLLLVSSLLESTILIWQEYITTRLKHRIELSLGLRGISGMILS
jgi:hypothetical protein